MNLSRAFIDKELAIINGDDLQQQYLASQLNKSMH